ncbi:MAG: TlpA family protein disulfide reductase [Acidobacteria bacterium]|nr:TlpA family protein disulfide reductase [Acidobacteriota bacterium]
MSRVFPRDVRAVFVLSVFTFAMALGVGACGPPQKHDEIADLGFIVKDMEGNDVKLSDYRGRPLIVNFWFVDCPPCRQEVPAFVDLVKRYGDKGFTVLGLSVQDTAEAMQVFAEEFDVNYPLFVDDGRDDILNAYRATFAYPVSWFVKADGTVLLKHLGTGTPEWFERQVVALFE